MLIRTATQCSRSCGNHASCRMIAPAAKPPSVSRQWPVTLLPQLSPMPSPSPPRKKLYVQPPRRLRSQAFAATAPTTSWAAANRRGPRRRQELPPTAARRRRFNVSAAGAGHSHGHRHRFQHTHGRHGIPTTHPPPLRPLTDRRALPTARSLAEALAAGYSRGPVATVAHEGGRRHWKPRRSQQLRTRSVCAATPAINATTVEAQPAATFPTYSMSTSPRTPPPLPSLRPEMQSVAPMAPPPAR